MDGMPQWKFDSTKGNFDLMFTNVEDMTQFLNGIIIPIAAQLGLEVSVKPLVKKEAKLEIIRG